MSPARIVWFDQWFALSPVGNDKRVRWEHSKHFNSCVTFRKRRSVRLLTLACGKKEKRSDYQTTFLFLNFGKQFYNPFLFRRVIISFLREIGNEPPCI